LLALPVNARLAIGDSAVIVLTGLRNPCSQTDGFRQGLMAAVLDRDAEGKLMRKAGVMAVVLSGGFVKVDDAINATLPALPRRAMERV
jgi:MOSC domain-containing protein YiiM